jgi:hypothetical protein
LGIGFWTVGVSVVFGALSASAAVDKVKDVIARLTLSKTAIMARTTAETGRAIRRFQYRTVVSTQRIVVIGGLIRGETETLLRRSWPALWLPGE